MSCKDYEAIAAAIKSVADAVDDGQRDIVWQVAACISRTLQNDNPRFDHGKFREACGMID